MLAKLDVMSQEIKEIRDSTSTVNDALEGHETRIKDIENALEYNDHEVEDLKTAASDNKIDIEKLNQRIVELEAVAKRNTELENKLAELETYNRRENLLFDGIPERDEEDTKGLILDLIKSKLQVTEKVEIQRCHRLGKVQTNIQQSSKFPRRIIVRLLRYEDRMAIWAKRRLLKGTSIYMREDFAALVEAKRKGLYPVLKLAKTLDTKARLQKDKLFFKNELYTLANLPLALLNAGEAGPSTRIAGKYICFGGRASPLSNFFPVSLDISGKKYNCVEQFYQYKKALFGGSDSVAGEIMQEDDPAKQKRLGDGIRVDKSWYTEAGMEAMKEAITIKFTENQKLKTYLKKHKDLTVVECNPHDKHWSCGLALKDKNANDCTTWKGKNTIGVIYSQVIPGIKF